MLSATLITAVFVARVAAESQSAVALTPSNGWYGVDGNWSAIELQVGTPGQTVNVLPSTSLSEFWVIGAGGCDANGSLCNSARGGVFEMAGSKSWSSLGTWQLGFDYLNNGGNGDYGLETLSATLLEGDGLLSMDNIITASINTTSYYLGFLGLGVTKGSFGNRVAESPFSQAVKKYGRIPSYSYGYTAGAHYMGVSGTPCSLTLGGYDESRFIQHNNEFSLDPSDGLPHALVRAIEVTTGQDKVLPGGWNTSTRILSDMSTSFIAMIDSSTPYLWLPDAICDQFAQAFNLTYNSTFELYTLTDGQYTDFKSASSSYSFTFSFTSQDNSDDFGHPLTVPGVVNITITAAAFAQSLRYPFQSDAIQDGDPAVPYFPLRRASSLTDTFIIGRSFLQEAYLITKYDTGVFSLHQALFPDEPLESVQLRNVAQPNNSTFPPPSNLHGGLSTAQMGGIAAGATAGCVIMLACWYLYRRQKKSRANIRALEDAKDAASSIMPEPPKRPVTMVFTKILGKKKAKRASAHEVMGSSSHPAEVGADANHALYELPVLANPTELGGDDCKSALSHTDLEVGGRYSSMGPFDVGTRNVEIRLQSPVPAYSPPGTPAAFPPSEKLLRDTSPAATSRPEEYRSLPSVSPTSIRGSLPSPLSFRSGEWTNRTSDLLSPWMDGQSLHEPAFTGNNAENPFLYPVSPESEVFTSSTANSSNMPPPIPVSVLPTSPLPTHRRAPPMEFTNVICLGPLPDNIALPAPPARPPRPPPPAPPPVIPDVAVSEILAANRASTDTLGSNWTEFEEELIAQEITRQESLREQVRNQDLEPSSPLSLHRLDGTELIHIPQPAERRYSWEN
ncbi:eukaryotic aspartyl protease [Colletotrichum navitas]|uniref:Eukaryotic aspartyl protease n=1 Tax=Colletotrichum navitas TaxID=681940 RepID=A0AAD8V8V1_9PEZI|nr:eukaryotic aspartyl protease [Colletotrichum navitas]KAK1597289.1 eukaryotic aspartyl protease [Colletotrichum navitas]